MSYIQVEVNLEDIIGNIYTEDIIDELVSRGDLFNVLDDVHSNEILDYLDDRYGGPIGRRFL